MPSEPTETLITDPQDYVQGIRNDIQNAKMSVDLESYIFDEDTVGRSIAQALGEASQRGIAVRVLVDGVGSPWFGGKLAERLTRAGAQVRIYHPAPWNFWQWKLTNPSSSFWKRFFERLSLLNKRNHRKVCLIDRHIAWVGSFNITQRHQHGWKDMAVRKLFKDASPLETAFESAWNRKNRSKEAFSFTGPIRLNFTRRLRRANFEDLVNRLEEAKERIWICTPYFIPDYALLRPLTAAARRGVDVRVLLPQGSDVFFMPWIASTFYWPLLKSNVRIFEFETGFIHAKILVIDSFSMIGSSNFNHRSLLHDLEVDLQLTTDQVKKELDKKLLADFQQSRQISLSKTSNRNILVRFLGHLLLLWKHWL